MSAEVDNMILDHESALDRQMAIRAPHPEAMHAFSTGATRSSSEGKLNYEGFLSPRVLRRFAQYMHKHRVQADGLVREADNWQKGMARQRYRESLIRHFMETWLAWRGVTISPEGPRDPQDEEELLCALMFNVQGLLHEMIIGRDIK